MKMLNLMYQKRLNSEKMKVFLLIWSPLYSPDINTIEFVWKYLKDYVEKQQPKTQEDLESAIRNGWDNVNQELIDNCINHVHERLNEIFESNWEFI